MWTILQMCLNQIPTATVKQNPVTLCTIYYFINYLLVVSVVSYKLKCCCLPELQTDDRSLDLIFIFTSWKIQDSIDANSHNKPDLFVVLNFIWHLCAPLDIFPYNVEQFFGSYVSGYKRLHE